MKHLLKLGALALSIAITFGSCKKENKDEIIVNYSPETVDVNPIIKRMQSFSADTLHIGYVAIPYPVEFKQSVKKLTVNDSTKLNAMYNIADSVVDFVYPFKAIVKSNSTTIRNVEVL